MFSSAHNPSSAYSKVGIETGVGSASPHQLILMLFDGAVLALSSAAVQMREKRSIDKGQSISRAIDIIANGLKASLDRNVGGELADRLAALYDYMCARLLQANLRDDLAALTEVTGLLGELRGAWEEIADDPAVLSANKGQR
jgi:flagellar secretion chaperone FliS